VGHGLLLADDPRAFADVVVELLRDPERAGALGRAGNEAAREQLSWDRTLAPLVDAVRDGVSG
jgi:glycosyltransferase involved in cell wall biosynthesis